MTLGSAVDSTSSDAPVPPPIARIEGEHEEILVVAPDVLVAGEATLHLEEASRAGGEAIEVRTRAPRRRACGDRTRKRGIR